MNTSFNIAHLWQHGDAITITTAIILLIMSIMTWSIIIIKLVQLYTLKRQSKLATNFWHESSYEDGLNRLGNDKNSPWYQLAIEGQDVVKHRSNTHEQLHDSLDLSDWFMLMLRHTLEIISERMNSGLSILASIASTAPFIGLFGTVWGIYHAMMGLSQSDAASIDKVAGPIGEALIMTACGLAVAIPAVLGYNALVRSNKIIQHKLRNFAHDLHIYWVTGANNKTR